MTLVLRSTDIWTVRRVRIPVELKAHYAAAPHVVAASIVTPALLWLVL